MRKKWSIVVAALLTITSVVSLGFGCSPRKTATETSQPPTDLCGTKSVNGLSLSLSLNSTTLQPGQEIVVTIDEQNTLTAVNYVPASDNWPLKGLTLGPCGTLNYPIGVAIFQGYYTCSNILSGTPLQLYKPVVYSCPSILSRIDAYAFQPSSDNASVFGSCDPNPCFSYNMTSKVSATGYWTNAHESAPNNFEPGDYTVAGGDEWGTLVVLHFIVQDNAKSP